MAVQEALYLECERSLVPTSSTCLRTSRMSAFSSEHDSFVRSDTLCA